ncbi:Molydopterin dinucleotide binding domain-containing protein [Aquamicrobium aerolatum DSM 21857]|uniref:Molydopterin dinucleotide binding domain-containing protein n=1 Tax=Aquamicrobium aerolatum DSM 21857 TaxID=1121003 RepID=A0A1I3SCH2_9HYPH|nr:Molydopterin dinucleotide binding domain-containing protein [Aquamicrobium aerolatum DSM 21857]
MEVGASGKPGAVQIFNERGVCTAIAAVDARMRESVVLLPTGADYLGTAPRDEVSSQADRGSNPNVLTKDVGTSVLGQGCAAQSCLVDVRPAKSA